MESESGTWFDQLSRAVGSAASRRTIVRTVGAGVLGHAVTTGGPAASVAALDATRGGDTCRRRSRRCRREMTVHCDREWHALRAECRQATFACCQHYAECKAKDAKRCKRSSRFLSSR